MSRSPDFVQLTQQAKQWGTKLGFQQVGITDTDLSAGEPRPQVWLDKQYRDEMEWMARHDMMHTRPHELLLGTLRVISVRTSYLPANAAFARTLKDPALDYVSRYVLGRGHHKLLRSRLKKLGRKIQEQCVPLNFRPFVDSASILEQPIAEKADLGWTGKHSLILSRDAGSFFFLGEPLVGLPLPVDGLVAEECGRCVACMTICPTGTIVEPHAVDTRRCISYPTIELEGSIPEEFRLLIGSRTYGCDDRQLICPWNRSSQLTDEEDFNPRKALYAPSLAELFAWSEVWFLKATEGSAIRHIGYLRWLCNIIVVLGNALWDEAHLRALESRRGEHPLLDEHTKRAIAKQINKRNADAVEIQLPKKLHLVRVVEKGLPCDV